MSLQAQVTPSRPPPLLLSSAPPPPLRTARPAPSVGGKLGARGSGRGAGPSLREPSVPLPPRPPAASAEPSVWELELSYEPARPLSVAERLAELEIRLLKLQAELFTPAGGWERARELAESKGLMVTEVQWPVPDVVVERRPRNPPSTTPAVKAIKRAPLLGVGPTAPAKAAQKPTVLAPAVSPAVSRPIKAVAVPSEPVVATPKARAAAMTGLAASPDKRSTDDIIRPSSGDQPLAPQTVAANAPKPSSAMREGRDTQRSIPAPKTSVKADPKLATLKDTAAGPSKLPLWQTAHPPRQVSTGLMSACGSHGEF